jgi:hypothetical protein
VIARRPRYRAIGLGPNTWCRNCVSFEARPETEPGGWCRRFRNVVWTRYRVHCGDYREPWARVLATTEEPT